MGAGLDFIGAVRHVVEKWSDKRDPLCEELSRFLHELSLGKTRNEALEDLAYRAPTELVKAFVTNAIQAEKRGTPLVEILRIQADVARTKRFQTAEKIAGRAGVVILMPLMFIFAATVLVMFGSLIVKGFRGQLFYDAPSVRHGGGDAATGSRSCCSCRSSAASRSRTPFDQPRVLVGRGARRRPAHRARRRLALAVPRRARRSAPRASRASASRRYEATNPTYVNDRPAVEGTLMPGDVDRRRPTCAWCSSARSRSARSRQAGQLPAVAHDPA